MADETLDRFVNKLISGRFIGAEERVVRERESQSDDLVKLEGVVLYQVSSRLKKELLAANHRFNYESVNNHRDLDDSAIIHGVDDITAFVVGEYDGGLLDSLATTSIPVYFDKGREKNLNIPEGVIVIPVRKSDRKKILAEITGYSVEKKNVDEALPELTMDVFEGYTAKESKSYIGAIRRFQDDYGKVLGVRIKGQFGDDDCRASLDLADGHGGMVTYGIDDLVSKVNSEAGKLVMTLALMGKKNVEKTKNRITYSAMNNEAKRIIESRMGSISRIVDKSLNPAKYGGSDSGVYGRKCKRARDK